MDSVKGQFDAVMGYLVRNAETIERSVDVLGLTPEEAILAAVRRCFSIRAVETESKGNPAHEPTDS